MAGYLDHTFKYSKYPKYYFKEIDAKKPDKIRSRARANKHKML